MKTKKEETPENESEVLPSDDLTENTDVIDDGITEPETNAEYWRLKYEKCITALKHAKMESLIGTYDL